MGISRSVCTILCYLMIYDISGQSSSKVAIVLSGTATAQDPIAVDATNGWPSVVKNRISPGYNVGLHVVLNVGRSPARTWLSAEGEYGFFISRWDVSIPASSVNSTNVPRFEDLIHPGGVSTSIRQWSVHYGRNLQKRHGLSVQPYIGLGITETVLASLVSVLPSYSDTISYGVVEVNYGGRPRVAPALRLGANLTWPCGARNAWGLGMLVSLSPVQYIRGGYVVFPGTSAEMRGAFRGGMSYVGVRLFHRFGLGAQAD